MRWLNKQFIKKAMNFTKAITNNYYVMKEIKIQWEQENYEQ